jgi:hypothetical protein
MWKTIVQATDASIIWRMRFACWIFKATNTHSQHVIITALPLRQWLHGGASILRCTYIDFLYFALKIRNENALAFSQELSWNLILGTFIEISHYVSISVKIAQSCGHIARINVGLSARIYVAKLEILY